MPVKLPLVHHETCTVKELRHLLRRLPKNLPVTAHCDGRVVGIKLSGAKLLVNIGNEKQVHLCIDVDN